jgi:5-deoxy-glucuronate isomerase
MAVHNEWYFPRGALRRGGWESVVDQSLDGWAHTGIRVAEIDGDALTVAAADVERLIIPLSGAFWVGHDSTTTALHGRPTVFDGPTDVLYVGSGAELSIHGRGRVAIAEAPAAGLKPSRYIAREEVPVEIRGAGRDTRQVHNFGTPAVLDAESFIVCEVITPSGNWSSHPAHKHDEHRPGHESRLEEIYYFEVATARGTSAPATVEPFGTFATYSSDAGEIDTNALVHTGDIALVPFGYHGPASAAPEYDLYYLNVMAGPDPERAWQVADDPAQAWIRTNWDSLAPDDRLPFLPISTGANA